MRIIIAILILLASVSVNAEPIILESKTEVQSTGTIGGSWNPVNSYLELTDGIYSLIVDPNEIYSNHKLILGSSQNYPILFRNVSDSGMTDLMVIRQDGHVGVGTTTPTYGKLQINGSGPTEGLTIWTNQGETTSRIWINPTSNLLHISRGGNPDNGITIKNDGKVAIGRSPTTYKLDINGTVRCSTLTESSDFRLKESIASMGGSLDRISRLRGVKYRLKKQPQEGLFDEHYSVEGESSKKGVGRKKDSKTEREKLGLIAQEVEQIFPEAVYTDEEGYKSIAYGQLVAPLIEAVKELNLENETIKENIPQLHASINGLKDENTLLRSKIEQMTAEIEEIRGLLP